MPYCAPRNRTATGLTELSRRLAQVVRCLEFNINGAVAEGDIIEDLQRFTKAVQTKLENEGWSFSYDAGPKLKARPPGHPHPFPRRTVP